MSAWWVWWYSFHLSMDVNRGAGNCHWPTGCGTGWGSFVGGVPRGLRHTKLLKLKEALGAWWGRCHAPSLSAFDVLGRGIGSEVFAVSISGSGKSDGMASHFVVSGFSSALLGSRDKARLITRPARSSIASPQARTDWEPYMHRRHRTGIRGGWFLSERTVGQHRGRPCVSSFSRPQKACAFATPQPAQTRVHVRLPTPRRERGERELGEVSSEK